LTFDLNNNNKKSLKVAATFVLSFKMSAVLAETIVKLLFEHAIAL